MSFWLNHFENHLWLYMEVGVVLAALLYLVYSRQAGRQLKRLVAGNLPLLRVHHRPWAQRLRRVCLLGSLFFLVIALAGPKFGVKEKTIQIKGIDIVLAVDLSKSMNAMDVKPSRLEKTKYLITDLLGRSMGHRLALVAFSGVAFVQAPLTNDYAAIAGFADILSTDLIPVGGTNLQAVLEKCLNLFDEKSRKYKAVLLLTDGQETQGQYREVLERLTKQGVRLFVIGVARDTSVPIPVYNETGRLVDYKRDNKGRIVKTSLNKEALSDMARQTGGAFFPLEQTGNVIVKVIRKLEDMEKRELEAVRSSDLVNRYYYFLFLSLVLLIVYCYFKYPLRGEVSLEYLR